jgi:hypothetical protein
MLYDYISAVAVAFFDDAVHVIWVVVIIFRLIFFYTLDVKKERDIVFLSKRWMKRGKETN